MNERVKRQAGALLLRSAGASAQTAALSIIREGRVKCSRNLMEFVVSVCTIAFTLVFWTLMEKETVMSESRMTPCRQRVERSLRRC